MQNTMIEFASWTSKCPKFCTMATTVRMLEVAGRSLDTPSKIARHPEIAFRKFRMKVRAIPRWPPDLGGDVRRVAFTCSARMRTGGAVRAYLDSSRRESYCCGGAKAPRDPGKKVPGAVCPSYGPRHLLPVAPGPQRPLQRLSALVPASPAH